MTYRMPYLDRWKTQSPPEDNIPEGKCGFCGEPSERLFCSAACKIAEDND